MWEGRGVCCHIYIHSYVSVCVCVAVAVSVCVYFCFSYFFFVIWLNFFCCIKRSPVLDAWIWLNKTSTIYIYIGTYIFRCVFRGMYIFVGMLVYVCVHMHIYIHTFTYLTLEKVCSNAMHARRHTCVCMHDVYNDSMQHISLNTSQQ